MSNFNTSTVFDTQNSDPFNGPLVSPGLKRTRQGSFKATILSEDNKSIDPALLNGLKALKNAIVPDGKMPTSMVVVNIDQRKAIVNKDKNNNDDDEEDVNPEFINDFNKHIGNTKKKEEAKRLIKKMRRLGGLIPTLEHDEIDIPAARLGLSYLASLNNPNYKMEALDNLLLLLQNDNIDKETSSGLVTLAISLMKRMNRELMQTEILDVQIKITQVYSLVAELLQRHYSKKHINAITKDLKIELISTIKALEALNSQEDVKLNFYAKLALEGVRRIVDDRKELFDLIERFCHASMAVYALQFDQGDTSTGFQELVNTFKDLDPHIKGSWYNGVLILNELVKEAKSDLSNLTAAEFHIREERALNQLKTIQVLIREKGHQYNWKFTYAAIEVLAELSLYGSTAKIRERAFQGIKSMGPDFPGLITFADEKSLSKYLDLSPMAHFKKPRRKNPNIIIRRLCVEHLATIAHESEDADIRKKATTLLTQRLALEPKVSILSYLTSVAMENEDPAIVSKAKLLLIKRLKIEKKESTIAYLRTIIPESKEAQLVWLRRGQDITPGASYSYSDL